MPLVATVICAAFIAHLFWTDLKRPHRPSLALWVPLVWMFLAGSRHVSAWLDLSPTFASASDYADGSPLDRAVSFVLIMLGIFILAKRRIDWERLLVKNAWIVLYLLYCLASVTWTDDPAILLRRWAKELGNPIMALVILTERRPYDAVATILRRLAFLLLPLSVLFVRYFPELARTYAPDGSQMFTGVGQQKNALGMMCLVAGIYGFWVLLQRQQEAQRRLVRPHRLIAFVLTGMLVWLLYLSNSQTSLVCLVAAVLLLLAGRIPVIVERPSRVLGVVFWGGLSIWLLDEALNLKELALSLLGREPTLTNRTHVWETLGRFTQNPIVGTGFMSFWAGARLDEIWRLLGPGIVQAHSGYLEQYLNLGYIGLAFIGIIVLSGLLHVRGHLNVDPAAGMLRLCFILTAILYNYTEASFYGMNNMWMLLLLGCIEVPRQRLVRVSPSKQATMQGMTYRQWPPRVANTGTPPPQTRSKPADSMASALRHRAGAMKSWPPEP